MCEGEDGVEDVGGDVETGIVGVEREVWEEGELPADGLGVPALLPVGVERAVPTPLTSLLMPSSPPPYHPDDDIPRCPFVSRFAVYFYVFLLLGAFFLLDLLGFSVFCGAFGVWIVWF